MAGHCPVKLDCFQLVLRAFIVKSIWLVEGPDGTMLTLPITESEYDKSFDSWAAIIKSTALERTLFK